MDVVLENNEPNPQVLATEERRRLELRMYLPGIQERSVSEDTLEGVEGLFASDHTRGDLPVVGIKLASTGSATPHDRDEAQGQRDGTDSVILGDRSQHPAPGGAYTIWNIPMSPWGGRIVVGETPRTCLIASRVKASSATICSLVRVVRSLWDQVCTLIS
jgi:hypothetical protein